jgi:hypothetical protein
MQHEYYHHLFQLFKQFGLEAKSHQWFDRSTWPDDFEGVIEPDYYHEALHKRFTTPDLHPPLWFQMKKWNAAALTGGEALPWPAVAAALTGKFHASDPANAWHQGSLTPGSEEGVLTWANRAGASWRFTVDLVTGAMKAVDGPYADTTGQVSAGWVGGGGHGCVSRRPTAVCATAVVGRCCTTPCNIAGTCVAPLHLVRLWGHLLRRLRAPTPARGARPRRPRCQYPLPPSATPCHPPPPSRPATVSPSLVLRVRALRHWTVNTGWTAWSSPPSPCQSPRGLAQIQLEPHLVGKGAAAELGGDDGGGGAGGGGGQRWRITGFQFNGDRFARPAK